MSFYENESCPVCDRKFTEEDVIVICPKCGTPHHRQCYNSLGHCANEDKHSTDFSYTPKSQTPEHRSPGVPDNKDTNGEDSRYKNFGYNKETSKADQRNSERHCVNCGEKIDGDAPFCGRCGTRQPSSQYPPYKPPLIFSESTENEYEKSNEKIDEMNVSDVAAVVRTNTRRFIPKFIQNKKFSWNWGALIFGPYYLFFRKMYKEGAMALAVRLIVSLIAQGIYIEQFSAFSSFLMSNINTLSSNPSKELLTQFNQLYNAVLPMMLIILVANVIINIVTALFADRFYRAKAIAVVDNVNKKLADGNIFAQTMPVIQEEMNLSQEEMKKLYLSRLGGTSFMSPVFAFLIYDVVTSMISSL